MWTRFTLAYLFGVLAAIKVQCAQEDELCPRQGNLSFHFKIQSRILSNWISYTWLVLRSVLTLKTWINSFIDLLGYDSPLTQWLMVMMSACGKEAKSLLIDIP